MKIVLVSTATTYENSADLQRYRNTLLLWSGFQDFKKKKLYGLFLLWMGSNCLKATATSRRQFTFYIYYWFLMLYPLIFLFYQARYTNDWISQKNYSCPTETLYSENSRDDFSKLFSYLHHLMLTYHNDSLYTIHLVISWLVFTSVFTVKKNFKLLIVCSTDTCQLNSLCLVLAW